jgi:hypothetical protein
VLEEVSRYSWVNTRVVFFTAIYTVYGHGEGRRRSGILAFG